MVKRVRTHFDRKLLIRDDIIADPRNVTVALSHIRGLGILYGGQTVKLFSLEIHQLNFRSTSETK